MNVVYTKENGRMISVDLDGSRNSIRDNAELTTDDQAAELLTSNPELLSMSEDDWFSY